MNLTQIPSDLPVPIDDGAAAHLTGALLPNVTLISTDGNLLNLAKLNGWCVIYIYPMTGRPDTDLPDNWDAIPGARGCTPQSCSFRDHYADLQKLNAAVYGLSVQGTDYQREAQQRLHLPFSLLSDENLQLKAALQLPTLCVAGMELYRRLTLIAENRQIKKVFYPVFPPDQNADEVLAWLRKNLPMMSG